MWIYFLHRFWIITVWVNRFFYVDKFVEQIFFCVQICWIGFLFFYVNIFFAQVLDHYCLGEHIFFIKFPLNRFFYRLNRFKKEKKKKRLLMFQIKPTKPIKLSWSNRIAIGQKINPNRCASVLIIIKPIPIGLVTNLKKNWVDQTAHTPKWNK